ncbi:DNA-3-methyladenine glycosylase family protein [Nesterenkonia ebinurensis]|uniref:DNA-3-methyladenine glycosylase family protein n=1 Tax=Nesterenkonia ebinurensis TaxID=2608252 RepID=UPI00168AC03E|nr:3-methyladenine DNA glycosylase [Nesterenkonia ebinurensis]
MTYLGERVVDLGSPYDLAGTLGVLQRGHGDPAIRLAEQRAWMCQRMYDAVGTELGAVTYRFDQVSASEVRVQIAADSAEALESALDRSPTILGSEDDWTELELLLDALGDRISTTLAQVRRRHPGVRLPATGALFDQLVTVTLEQKVTHEQARYSWRNLLRKYGDRPPGWVSCEQSDAATSGAKAAAMRPRAVPDGGRDVGDSYKQSAVCADHVGVCAPVGPALRLPLSPTQLKAVPSWEWHRLWVQPSLSKTVLRLAERAHSIHRLGAATTVDAFEVGELAEQLIAIPGIGQWTVAEALQRSHGAADLPAVGDYHLAHFVGEALTGQRTDDAGMLRLLEPFAPHRQRIIRLLLLSGFRMSRLGPRLTPEDHRER